MFTKSFWKQALERMVKAFASTTISLYVVGNGFDAFSVNWHRWLGIALGASVASLCLSIVSSKIGPDNSPSVVSTE